MLNSRWTTLACAVVFVALGTLGCGRNDAPAPNDRTTGGTTEPADAHPTEGPHGGGLVELGNEEYHGELVHDENGGTVTIYILDGHAEQVVPIDATEVTINLTHDGQPEQFKLAASPQEDDPAGKSSRFVSSDEELAHGLDHEDANPRLVVTIAGKQYRGNIAHPHAEGEER